MEDGETIDLQNKTDKVHSAFSRALAVLSRHNAVILIFSVFFGVAVVGVLVLRDLREANAEAREMYTRSIYGLKRIAEMQYAAQETRRCTLYALTTTDSNLQVQYADQSRDADQEVKSRIAEIMLRANSPFEKEVGNRLSNEWAAYLGVRDEVLALILEGSTKEAVTMDLSGGVPAFERVRQDMLLVQRLYDEDGSKRQANLAASSRRSSAKLVGILGITFLLSMLAVIGIQRSRVLSAIQLTRLQMEFVASMSHELRTPLAAINSAADNLADGLVKGPRAVRKYGYLMRQQSRNISDLVDRILLFASTDDKHLENAMEPLSASSIIDAVVDRIEARLEHSSFTVERHIEQELPPVLANQVGLSQCLHSLVDNAIKYSDGGRGVSVRAFGAPLPGGDSRELCIAVADHGIGIEPSELSRIFDPFYRSPRVQTAQIHGTGLGLSLAKRIAESMGGSISVESELCRGSVFTLHLQFANNKDSPNPSGIPQMETLNG